MSKPIKHGDYEIPFDCRFAYWTLLGRYGQTEQSEITGKFRNIDLSVVSGKSSVPRKLRKMMADPKCKGLVKAENAPGKNYKLFWIPAKEQIRTLFDLPPRERPE